MRLLHEALIPYLPCQYFLKGNTNMKIKTHPKDSPRNNSRKKRFYQKKWFWAALIVLFAISMANLDDTPTHSKEASEEINPLIIQSPEETLEVEEILDSHGDPIEFHPTKLSDDATGNWVVSIIENNIQPEEYARDYYKRYFGDDGEVHFIVNLNYNTTTSISCLGGILNVRVHEYVPKEEHSANTLGSGMLYAEYLVYPDTGEVEKVQ